MKRFKVFLLFVSLFVLFISAASASNILRVEIGDGKSISQIKQKIEIEGRDVIVFTRGGKAILPDLEKVRATGIGISVVPNELSFTFNSQQYPWSSEELTALNQWTNDFYPMIKKIYGAPAFNITVNFEKNPFISSAALYNMTTNTIILRDLKSPDPSYHEMTHAFHDDLIIENPVYEEGMVRATEVEGFNRLEEYPYWDRHHAYSIDVYYEHDNQPAVGCENGNLFAGFNVLLRYQQAGCALGKMLIEKPSFLAKFNQQYYAQAYLDPSISSNTTALKSIAREIKPNVEGKKFDKWYSRQNIFNFDPPEGYQVMLRGYDKTLYVFYRYDYGYENMIAGAEVSWQIYDCYENLLRSGTDATNNWGWVEIPTHSLGYEGRIRIDVTISVYGGEIKQSFLSSTALPSGLFGIVKNRKGGKVKVYDKNGIRVGKALVVNGAFAIPEVENLAGKFTVRYYSNSGVLLATKIITKDSSSYYVILND